jgi:hypothetical protein
MKKIFFAMLMVSSYFILPSCSKSSDSTPASTDVTAVMVVTANGVIVANNGTVFLDDSVVVTVTCTGNASNALTNLKITCTDPNFNLSTGVYQTALTGIAAIKSAPRWPAQGDVPVTFTATVTGAAGNPAVVTCKLNVVQVIRGQQLIGNQLNASAIQLYSSSVINPTTSTATFGLTDIASVPQLDTAIDFAYFSRTTFNYIGSPDDTGTLSVYGSLANGNMAGWAHRNKTRFILTNISSGVFDLATTNLAMLGLLNTAKAGGEPNLKSISVLDAQVYLFKTEAGKYGLMRIQSPQGGWEPSTATTVSGEVQLLIDFFN